MGDKKLIIVFFSDQNPEAISSLNDRGWKFAESLFQEFNLKIDKGSFGFANEPKEMKSHNLYDFARSKKRALQENEIFNLLYAAFHSLPDSCAQMSFEWLMEIECGHASKPCVDYVQVGIDTAVVGVPEVLKNEGSLERFCSRILEVLPDARYGLASIIQSKYLPGGYSIGLPGGAQDELIWDVNAWGRGYGVKFEKLRNVHGYNFLCQSLLDQFVGEVPLKEWIFSSEAERGRLSRFSNGLYLWKLIRGENLMDGLDWNHHFTVSIREELEERGTFAWQDWLRRKR